MYIELYNVFEYNANSNNQKQDRLVFNGYVLGNRIGIGIYLAHIPQKITLTVKDTTGQIDVFNR